MPWCWNYLTSSGNQHIRFQTNLDSFPQNNICSKEIYLWVTFFFFYWLVGYWIFGHQISFASLLVWFAWWKGLHKIFLFIKIHLRFDSNSTSQLLTWFHSDHDMQKGYSSLLSFTVTDINSTVTKLMALGAELDGPIKYEIHGKVTVSISIDVFNLIFSWPWSGESKSALCYQVAAMRCIDGHMLGLYEAA